MTSRYGAHPTIPDRSYKDSLREKAGRSTWKKSPLLVRNPSKDFDVFINDQTLIDEQIVIMGDSYSFVAKDLVGKELLRINKKFMNQGVDNLEFRVGHAIKRFKVNVIKQEYFNHSKEIEEIIEIFIKKRPDWNSLLFSEFTRDLEIAAKNNDVPLSYCAGAEELLFGLYEYDHCKISFSDKLQVANFKLLPWTAMSKFAWNIVSYVHFIRHQWEFINKISMGEKTYLTQAVHFYSESYNDVKKNYDKNQGDYSNIEVQPKLLIESDLIVIQAIDLLYSKNKSREAIFSKIDKLERLHSAQKNLSYSQSLQRELLLLARFYRKLNNHDKAPQKYKELQSELHNQPTSRHDWVEEAERYLSR